jgi:tetratricopeptide (TPR) repeat protein
MKKIVAFGFMVIGLLALAACASTNGAAAGDLSLEEAIEQAAREIAGGLPSGTRVAIAAFESETEQLSDYIMDELTFALVNNGMEVAERDNLDYVLKELNLQYTGNFSDESMQSIGKFVGAESVISGELVNTGGRYRFRVNPVNVEKAVRQRGAAFFVRNDRIMQGLVVALKSNKTVARSAGEKAGAVQESAAPMTAGAYLDRGIRLGNQGEHDSAIADFTEAIRLSPKYTAAYYNRGIAYAKKGDYDRAIADYTQAIRLDPDHAVG